MGSKVAVDAVRRAGRRHGLYLLQKVWKPTVAARGAWVSRPINNWVKATELLAKHSESEWHLAYVEAQVLTDSTRQSGDVVERMVAASEMDQKRNRELVKKLTRSLYFLIKHHIPHTTSFEDLICRQIDNGNEQMEEPLRAAPLYAIYFSKVTTAELMSSISHCIGID